MRNLTKPSFPEVLADNRDIWLDDYLRNPSEHNRIKYRHPTIKKTLMEETNGKCAYCESKVGHNCPGDIEHKIPVDDRPDLLFNWDNLIISCTECNRRKGTYYDESCMFLDPNKDDVESRLQHIGPLVFNKPGDVRAEVTVRLLEIDRPDGRPYLMGRKYEKLENTRGLVKSIVRENNVILKAFLIQELEVQCSTTEEYSAMVKAYVDGLPPGWANQTASPMGAT